jgi:hypothetical protein
MSSLENGTQVVARNLQKAIDELRRDMTKVEMWADALNGFTRPIAEYEATSSHLLARRENH